MLANSAYKAQLDKVTPVEGLGTALHQTKNVLKCVYDFAVQGGAVSTIALNDDAGNPAVLPAGAVVTRTYLDVITPATSGGSATVAAQLEAAADLLAATAVASVTGLVDGKPDGTASKMVKTTVARQAKIAIAVAALTAGKFNLFIEYVLGN